MSSEIRVQPPSIIPDKITKPIQLLAVWLAGLVILDATFLTAASKLQTPQWLPTLLVVAAILFVPLFLVLIFLMQTKFRPELQEDQFYSKYIETNRKNLESSQTTILAEAVKSRIAIEERFRMLETGIEGLKTSKFQSTEDASEEDVSTKTKNLQNQYATLLEQISHGLRTSIHGVKSATEHLRHEFRRDPPDMLKVQLILEDILQAASTQFALLETIRFQAPSQTTPALHLSTSSMLLDIIDPVIEMLASVAQRKQIQLVLPRQDLAKIPVDRRALKTALFNVLQNAIQYAGEASKVVIGLVGEENAAIISVTNKAPQIALEESEHIGKLGYRGPGATARLVSGGGMGLYATRQILRLHGGDVKIQHDAGGMVTVTLTVPVG